MNSTSSSLTTAATEIWHAGTSAVHGSLLVEKQLALAEDQLTIGDQDFRLSELRRICVVGGGKATAAMTEGLLVSLAPLTDKNAIHVFGQINVPESHFVANSRWTDVNRVVVRQVRPMSSNLPTAAAVDATREIMQMVSQLGEGDLCIALISGGSSSLLCQPAEGITLQQKIEVTNLLSGNGADIRQLNVVRQCLSDVKAGGLVRACGAEHMIVLVISDVIGDDLATIGSGPTFACEKRFTEALNILNRFDPEHMAPQKVREYLQFKAKSPTPPDQDRNQVARHLIVGNISTAVDAAVHHAKSLGFRVISEVARPPEPLESKARELVATLAASAGKTCLISGGEPTIKLAPVNQRGKGGRNQHFALFALKQWLQIDHGDSRRPFCLLSGGTDGEDGNTNVAGAWCDNELAARLESLNVNIDDYLDRADSGTLFQQSGNQFAPAATHTNVCDLRVFVCE